MEKLRELLQNGYFIKDKFDSKEDFFKKVYKILSADAVVKDGFYDEIVEREYNYPTGLKTLSIPVAITHTELEYVLKESIMFCNFEEPVEFNKMDNPTEKIMVEVAIMLVIKDKNNHMESLVELMNLIQSPKLIQLKEANNLDECIKIISEE